MYETFARFQSPGFIMRYIPRGLAAVSEPSITFLLPASRVVKNRLPIQETRVPSLIREDPTCHRTAKPLSQQLLSLEKQNY